MCPSAEGTPEARVLAALRSRGARGLRRVAFRPNRRTIWSLTRGGTTLNLQAAFREAPPEVLDALAVIAREAGGGGVAYRRAAAAVRAWPGLARGLGEARKAARRRGPGGRSRRRPRRPRRPGPCCGTPEQLGYLRALYRHLDATRFGGRLPDDLHLRLSRRMSSRLGQMVPDVRDGRRVVVEIALNVDLMLAGNGAERLDTLVHEMAHAADWIEDGGRGHGPSWRRRAAAAGCRPTPCHDGSFVRRARRSDPVTRVPSLPPAARAWRAA